ncbi:MAG: hypothetical protein H0X33_14395 [Taibaiella sp.]|nr:hypothetical protein [Taibaiella sp.]
MILGYYIVFDTTSATTTWLAAMEGKQQGATVFETSLTIDGRKVANVNTLNDFAADFDALKADGFAISPVSLSDTDFPAPQPLLEH